jgi:acetyl-CoA carboxylase carboxyl transferase subunit beta
MAWFRRKTVGIKTKISQQNNVPEGQWINCPTCSETINRRELNKNLLVCPRCGHHFRMNSIGYFDLLFDGGTYKLHDANVVSEDPLEFVDRKPYGERLAANREKTSLPDAVRSATGNIEGIKMGISCMDFSFIGGSMGSVVGEVISRGIKRACRQKTPFMVIAQSGGARMMEGALSLMQMAKTSVHLARLAELKLPFIVLLTNPTTGGVTASFAMLGDVHFAEPGALIGFAGPRVIRETMGQDLPEGFQRAEFVKEHGFVDRIVDRRHLREALGHILSLIIEAETA